MMNIFKKTNNIKVLPQKEYNKPMNYFLVDYENLASHGLKGIANLTSDDIVHIFFTAACDCLPFETHKEIIKSKAKIIYQKVENGVKNALDFQLSSFLGYLIKSNGIGAFNYYIVSEDKGYTALVKYWSKKNIKISMVFDLNKTSLETFSEQQVTNVTKDSLSEMKNKLKTVLKTDNEIKLVLSCIDRFKTKQHIHNALEKEFPSSDNHLARDIYKIIKPYINN